MEQNDKTNIIPAYLKCIFNVTLQKKNPSVYTDLCFKQVFAKCPPPAAARLTVHVAAGSRSRSATWRHAVHRRATLEINAPDPVTIDNRTHIDITFLYLKYLRNHLLQ